MTELVDALCEKKDYSEIETILENGADPNFISDERLTPLMYALQYPCGIDIIQLLINHGADPFLVVGDHTCMFFAYKIPLDIFKYFIDMGVHDKKLLKNMMGNENIYKKIQYILDAGYTDKYPDICLDALLDSILYRAFDIATLFLDYGVNPNTQDKNGNTVLHFCFGYPDFFYKLIAEYNADYNIPNNKGITPRQLFMTKYEKLGSDINMVMSIL